MAERWWSPWRGRIGAVALVLILAQTFIRGRILLDGFYTQDDYRMLQLGRDSTFGVDYLFQAYSGHVWPGGFVIAWLTAQGRPDLWSVTAISLLVLQLLAAVLMWLVLSRILPGSWLRLPPLIVFLFSPLTLWSLQWWAQAIGYLPVTVCLLLAVWALLVGLQDDRWWAGPLVWFAFVLGVSFQERAFLIPLVLAGVAACHHAQASLTSGIRIAFVTRIRLWLVLAATAAGLLVGHLSISGSTGGGGAQTLRSFAQVAIDLTFRTLLPGLWGGPWRAEVQSGTALLPAQGVVIAAAIASLLVLGVTLWRGGGRAAAAWLLLVLYVLADLALLYGGRLQTEMRLGLLPRYAADIVPVAAICGAWALRGLREREGAQPWQRWLRASVVVGVAAYLAGALVTTEFLAPHQQNRDDRAYVERLTEAIEDHPTATVYNSVPPEGVLIFWFGAEQRLATLSAVLPVKVPIDVPGPDLRVVDDDGVLVPPVLIDVRRFDLPDSACPVPVSDARAVVTTPGAIEAGYLLRLEYFTAEDAFLTMDTEGGAQTAVVESGAGRVDFVLGADVAGDIALRLDREATVCVTAVISGYPAVPHAD